MFVGMGSNSGDSLALLMEAVQRLVPLAGDPGVQRSSFWRSEPVGCPEGSPDFINAVAGFVPREGLTPRSCLDALQDVERVLGRRRGMIRNAPRSMDLDLLAFGQETLSEEDCFSAPALP